MNRLTSRMEDGTIYIKSETGNEGVGHFTTQRRLPEIMVRLAAYEDTGLEPEEIEKTLSLYRENRELYKKQTSLLKNILQAYKDLEEQGLLLKLPCKVGDTLYYIQNNKIRECIVDAFKLYKNEELNVGAIDNGAYWLIIISDIGKTVFLTREEAEKALEATNV